MKYLLDTNAVIALLKQNPAVNARFERHDPTDIGVSAIVAHELFFGAYKSQRRAQNLDDVDELRFETVDFDFEDARAAGEIRARLAAAGTPIGPLDVLIAGQALVRDLILITNNTREFRRVAGLQMEDWQSQPNV
jgi:tRNA(fMet)-specific endonuclease VapC